MANSTDFSNYNGSVSGRGITERTGTFPDDVASLLVERHDERILGARRADDLVSIDQRRLCIAPSPRSAAKVLLEVLSPMHRSISLADAYNIALLPDSINPVTIHRRRRSQVAACRSHFRGPKRMAIRLIDR